MSSPNKETETVASSSSEQDASVTAANLQGAAVEESRTAEGEQSAPSIDSTSQVAWIEDEDHKLLGYLQRQNDEMLEFIRKDANPPRKLSKLSIGLFAIVFLGTTIGSIALVSQGAGLRDLLVCSVGELILFVLVAVCVLGDLRPKRSEAAELLLDPQNRIGSQQYQLRQLGEMLAKWQASLESLKRKQQSLVAQNQSLSETSSAWEAKVRSVQGNCRLIEQEAEVRRGELENLKNQLSSSNDELSTIKQQCEEVLNETTALEQKVSERETFIAELDNRNANKNAEHEELLKTIADKESEIAEKNAELEQLSASVATKSEEHASLANQVAEFHAQLSELESKQKDLQNSIQEATELLQLREQTLSDICQQIEVANSAVELASITNEICVVEDAPIVVDLPSENAAENVVEAVAAEPAIDSGESVMAAKVEVNPVPSLRNPIRNEVAEQGLLCDELKDQVAVLKAEIIGLEHTVAELRSANQLLKAHAEANEPAKKEPVVEELPAIDHFESLLAMPTRNVRERENSVGEEITAKTKELEMRICELAVAEAKLKQAETDCMLANGQLEQARRGYSKLQEAATELEFSTTQRQSDLLAMEDKLSSLGTTIATEEGVLAELLERIEQGQRRLSELQDKSNVFDDVEDRIRIAQDQLIQMSDDLHAKETAYELRVRELETAIVNSSAEVDSLRSSKDLLDREISELKKVAETLHIEIAEGEAKRETLAEIENELAGLVAEKGVTEKAIDAGRATLDELHLAIAELKNSELKNAEQELKAFEDRRTFLKSEIALQEGRLNAIRTESKEIDAKLEELAKAESDLKQLKTDMAVQEALLGSLKSQQKTVEANVRVFEERRSELQVELESLTQAIADSVEQKVQAENAISLANQSLNDIRQQHSSVLNEIEILEKQRATGQAALEDIRKRSELESKEASERKSKIELDTELARKRFESADSELNAVVQTIQKKTAERDQLELQSDRLRKEIANGQAQLKEQCEAISAAEVALQQKVSEREVVQKKLADEQAEAAALNRNLEDLAGQITRAESRIAELQWLEGQYSTSKREAEDLQRVLSELRSKKLHLERDTQQAESSLQVLRNNENQLRSSCAQLNSTAEAIRSDLNQHKNQLRELQAQRSASESSLKQMQTRYSELSSAVTTLQNDGRRAEASNEEYRRQLWQLEQEVGQAQKVCAEWQDYIRRLQTESKQVADRKMAMEASLRENTLREKSLKDELARNRSQNSELMAEHKRLRVAISQCEEQLFVHQREVEKLVQAKMEALQSGERSRLELAQLGKQIEAGTSKVREIESRHGAVRTELSETERRLQLTREASDKLDSEYSQKRAKLAELEQDLQAQNRLAVEQKNAVNELRRELADLESNKRLLENSTRNLEERSSALAAVESEIAEKSASLSGLKTEIAKCKEDLIASESQVRQVSFTLEAMSSSISQKQAELADAESKLSSLRETSNQLTAQNREKESELQILNRREEQSNTRMQELRTELEQLQDQKKIAEQSLADESRRLSQVSVDRDAIEAELALKICEVEHLSQKAASIAEQVTVAETRQRVIDAECERRSVEIDLLSKELDQLQRCKTPLCDSIAELEAKRSDSDVRLRGLQQLELQVRTEIASLAESRESVGDELRSLEMKRQELSGQVVAAETELSKLNEERISLTSMLEAMNSSIQEMRSRVVVSPIQESLAELAEQSDVQSGLATAKEIEESDPASELDLMQLVDTVESLETEVSDAVNYTAIPSDSTNRSSKAEARDVWDDIMSFAQST